MNERRWTLRTVSELRNIYAGLNYETKFKIQIQETPVQTVNSPKVVIKKRKLNTLQ